MVDVSGFPGTAGNVFTPTAAWRGVELTLVLARELKVELRLARRCSEVVYISISLIFHRIRNAGIFLSCIRILAEVQDKGTRFPIKNQDRESLK